MKVLSIVLLVIALGLGGYAFYQKSQVEKLQVTIEDSQQEVNDMSSRLTSYQAQMDSLRMKNQELKETILKLAGDLNRETKNN